MIAVLRSLLRLGGERGPGGGRGGRDVLQIVKRNQSLHRGQWIFRFSITSSFSFPFKSIFESWFSIMYLSHLRLAARCSLKRFQFFRIIRCKKRNVPTRSIHHSLLLINPYFSAQTLALRFFRRKMTLPRPVRPHCATLSHFDPFSVAISPKTLVHLLGDNHMIISIS